MVVERLVLHRRTTQGIEGAVHIGNRLNAHGGEHLNEPQLQPIRRDLPYSKAKPYRLAQGIQHLLGEGLFELTHHAAQILVLHRLLPDRVIKSSSDPIVGRSKSSLYFSMSLKILPMIPE